VVLVTIYQYIWTFGQNKGEFETGTHMTKIYITFILMVFYIASQAQNIPQQELDQFNKERVNITKHGMYALGGWAVANFAVSGAGWARGTGSNKYFHMGNVLWNTVNLGLAIPGLVNSYRAGTAGMSWAKTFKAQSTSEKLFLFNAGLDVGYMMGGLAMHGFGRNSNKRELLDGFGNSLMLQGSFLLLFDTGMFLAHHIHLKRRIYKPFPELTFTGNGFYFRQVF
jgi:hypothetical protein